MSVSGIQKRKVNYHVLKSIQFYPEIGKKQK